MLSSDSKLKTHHSQLDVRFGELRMRRAVYSLLLSLLIVTAAAAQESYALRLIVVRTEAEAGGIIERLRSGAKFEDVGGGSVATYTKGELRPEFQAALEGLDPGQTSGVIRLGREFAILQFVGRGEVRPAASPSVGRG